MNKFSRSIAALITATALGVCTAAAAHAQPSAGDGDTVSGPQVLESGLTPEEAYAQSLAVLEASREELARSRSAGPLSRTFGAQTDAGMAASVSWPSYFSSSGLDAISCVIVVADLASCNTARNYAESALNLAAARYPSSVHNGKGTAERIGGNHEAVSSNPVSEQNMDRYNNGRGRWVGVTYGTTFAADVRCTGLLSTAKALGGLQTSL